MSVTTTREPQVEPRLRRAQRPWLVVTVREMVVKLTDKNFLVGTVVTLALIAGSVGLSAFLGSQATTYEVAVVPAESAAVADAAEEIVADSGDTLRPVAVTSHEAARQAVEDGEVDAALLRDGSWVVVGLDQVSSGLSDALGRAVEETVLAANAAEAGTSLEALREGAALRTELLDADAPPESAVFAMTFAFAFLFYMAAITFGLQIAQSVLEEKQNRVVEILATAIPIRQLLYGKVLGNSLLAFGQIALYGIVGLVAVNVADLAVEVGWMLSAAGWFVVYFVAGFAALAAVWAALGSLASRSEDLQNNTTSVMTVILVAMFAGLLAEGTWLVVASYVPVISSVAMPVRLLQGDVPVWEPLVSLLLTAVVAYGLLRLGERVYQRAVMQTGTALTWRKALRLEG
ncbi:ABC transporter permease [Quadrisphaera sp. GCM10027208]|uniref:ABC transporter permease n=1 Tax=Quadrisphaera sp. GCM10027208 TaxID=3273423 RepID=UPI003616C49F